MVEWIILEEVDEGTARVVALRPSTGDRRVLYRSEHPFPLRPSLHPDGTRVAIDAVSRNVLRGEYRARSGLVNLETGGVGWLKQSLDPKWRIGGAVFDDSGKRLCFEGAFSGAPVTDLYVVDVDFAGNSVRETLIAGAGNRLGLGVGAPCFLPGGRRLVYLQNLRPEGAWEVCLLDLEKPGESALTLDGRAPSVLSLQLTEGASAVPDVGLSYCADRGRVFFVAQTRGKTRQRLRWTPVDGGGFVDLGREHLRVEEICVAPEGDLCSYAADGQVYLADVETCDCIVLVPGDPTMSHRGLFFDLDAGCLWFCTTTSDGAFLRSVDLETQEVRDVLHLGPGISVLHGRPLPGTLRARALVEALPDAGSSPPDVGGVSARSGLSEDNRDTQVSDLRKVRLSHGPPETTPDYREPALSTAVDAGPRALFETAPAQSMVRPPSSQDSHPTSRDLPRASVDLDLDISIDLGSVDIVSAPLVAMRTSSAPVAVATPAAVAAPDPREDFAGFMKSLNHVEAAGDALRRLAEPDHRKDAHLRDSARLFLALHLRRAQDSSDALTDLVHGISAAAYLRLHEGEDPLRVLCERSRDNIRAGKGLPEVEEHYALAALRTIRMGEAFDFDGTFEEYESMLSQLAQLVEDAGDEAGGAVIENFARMYADSFTEVLEGSLRAGQKDAEAAPLATPARRPRTLTGLAVPGRARLTFPPVADSSVPVAVAVPVPVAVAVAVPVPKAPTPVPLVSVVEPAPQGTADEESEEWEWARLRATAESSNRKPDPVAPVVAIAPVALAAPISEADEEAEWRALREAARRSTPQNAPMIAPRFGPTHALSPLTLTGLDSGSSMDLPMTLPPPPFFVPIVAGAATLGGLAELIIGVKLGTVFVVLGLLGIASGIGLSGDRPLGYRLALPVFGANAVFLLMFAADAPPPWIPASVLTLSALASAACLVCLLLPDIRRRYIGRILPF
ncbi:MAG: hypothetical protein EXR76_11885 [Myxococcales bacterium]|nr:hypothetical protein [Myxococcales bacterium]